MVTSITPSQRVQWLAPSPMWGDHARWIRIPNQTLREQPVILRFANDTFMEELMAMLQHAPWRITEWIARPETWRKPMASPAPIQKTRPERHIVNMYNKTKLVMEQQSVGRQQAMMLARSNEAVFLYDQSRNNYDPIKLYQASQQRYYLVTASLTANESTYPDHLLDLSNNETASFVVRAVARRPEETQENIRTKKSKPLKITEAWYEYALVTTAHGLAWKELGPYQLESTALQKLVPGEEKQPLFPVNYQNQCGHQRQILAGTIPIGQRETWLAAPSAGDVDNTFIANPVLSHEGGITHIKEIFQSDVTEPWKALIEQAQWFKSSIGADAESSNDNAAADKAQALKTARDRLQTGSWYVLLNFANFLEEYLPDIWDVLQGKKVLEGKKVAKQQKFVDTLQRTKLSIDGVAQLVQENLAVSRYSTSPPFWKQIKRIYELEHFFGIDLRSADKDTILQQAISQRKTVMEDVAYAELERFMRKETAGKWYSMMDVIHYIEQNAPDIDRLKAYLLGDLSVAEFSRDTLAREFYDSLAIIDVTPALVKAIGVANVADHNVTIVTNLKDGLVQVKQYADGLEKVDTEFEREPLPFGDTRSVPIDARWPHFLFPLADPEPALALKDSVVVPDFEDSEIRQLKGLDKCIAMLDKMSDDVDDMVSKVDLSAQATGQFHRLPLLDPRSTRFVVRCVYEKPNCGPIFPPVLSKASCQLEFASFFDPDAPARPIRIPMPLDISPAGLRKYKKNTMFLMSDMLCGKMKRLRKYTFADLVLSVLPWPFHKDLPSAGPVGPCRDPNGTLGMFCSLSIPIVTLCAMILLMIMVKLFDIFFRWIPYLFVCLPIPGFRGKP